MKTLKGTPIENPVESEIQIEEVVIGYCNECGLKIEDCGICGEELFNSEEPYRLFDSVLCDVKGMIDNETGAELHFHKKCISHFNNATTKQANNPLGHREVCNSLLFESRRASQ